MRVVQTILAILTAFAFYGSVARIYRRQHRKKEAGPVRKVRAHDELRLTNL
jgi:hypothetical protein